MVGYLPETLNIGGVEYEVNTDFRASLSILTAFGDPDLTNEDKVRVMLVILFGDENLAKIDDYTEACKKALWFLNCGKDENGDAEESSLSPTMDWEQDELLIFSGIATTIGRDVRMDPACHYWAFMSYFLGMGECAFTVIRSIRRKMARHQKLEKWEQEFYRENRKVVEIKKEAEMKQRLFEQVFGR